MPYRYRAGMNLRRYLTASGISEAAFGARIGVSQAAVNRYVRRSRIPTPQIMSRIVEATDGQVTANDFYAEHPDTTRAA